MPKARRIGLCFAIVGFALAAQGCWNDEQDLTLLGDGGCRTADGGEGRPAYLTAVSAEACEAQCSAGDEQCTAVEYNAGNGSCEIHHEPITKFERIEGVTCYAMR